MFSYQKVLGHDKYGSHHISPYEPKPLKAKKAEDLPELRGGNRGEAIGFLQVLDFIKTDGIFSPQIDRSIKKTTTSTQVAWQKVMFRDYR